MPCKGYKWPQERIDAWKESEAYQRVIETFKGPKSEEQKRKMSEAKLGVKKSDEHRESMARAQRRRWATYREIQQENPDLDSREIWEKVKELS